LEANKPLWDIFTKKEEYSPSILDQYQRFPFYASKNRDIFRPVVSEFLIKNGLKVEYPSGKSFAVCLTHDIDVINIAKLPLRHVGRSLAIIKGRLDKKSNPLRDFQNIMDMEREHDARSSFYFMALEEGEEDFNYRIDDLRDELRNIIESGWEVGMHGGHHAYCDPEVLELEKARLDSVIGKKTTGYRNHFLRFGIPDTWHHLSKAGFLYDTTFGHYDCAGFRNGMCHPFRPYDLNKKSYLDILEIPLVIMDNTFDDYMRLNESGSWEITKRLIDITAKNNGVITILWHNTYLVTEKRKLYEKILKYCSDKNAWMTSGEDIRKFWSENVRNELYGDKQ
jgi:peptidoglycan/xylan/chitin deacetylase (PgdA/CDA1 family)